MLRRLGIGCLILAIHLSTAWSFNTALFNADVVSQGGVLLGQVRLRLGAVAPGAITYHTINDQLDSSIAGPRAFTVVSSTVPGFAPVSWMFCIDVFGAARAGQEYSYDVYLAYGITGRLLRHWRDTPNDFPPAILDANFRAAGMQIALWEYSYDGAVNHPINLRNGNFVHLNNFPSYPAGAGTAIDTSAQWLIDKQYGRAFYWYLRAVDQNAQDFATVPEPSGFVALATTIVLACLRSRRKWVRPDRT